jgi:hypothetical protein
MGESVLKIAIPIFVVVTISESKNPTLAIHMSSLSYVHPHLSHLSTPGVVECLMTWVNKALRTKNILIKDKPNHHTSYCYKIKSMFILEGSHK